MEGCLWLFFRYIRTIRTSFPSDDRRAYNTIDLPVTCITVNNYCSYRKSQGYPVNHRYSRYYLCSMTRFSMGFAMASTFALAFKEMVLKVLRRVL
jgi:hypothetical protein